MNFDKIKFDAVQAAAEFETFKHWISSRNHFTESAVVAEIAARRQMACLLGYTILMPPPDLIKFEFGVKGLFKADLAVGNNKSRKFVLIEFEDAHENSLFKGGTRSYRHWSPRLEHGFGQILDWGWAKHTHPNDAAFMNSFGGKVLDDCYVVVLPVAVTLDSDAQKAFEDSSLAAMIGLHEKLEERSADVDALLAADAAMSACDVAMLHLKTIVGDAINRMSGVVHHVQLSDEARKDEFERYQSYLRLCGEDAGQPTEMRLTYALVRGIS